jgi:hypothetical protein
MISSNLLVLVAFFAIEVLFAFISIATGILPIYVIVVICGILCSIIEGKI